MKKIPIILIFFLLSIKWTYSQNQNQINEVSIKIAAVGDLVMHIPVKMSAKMHNIVKNGASINNNGFDYLFEPTAKIFKSHDAAIANMEFPIIKPYNSKAFSFNCEPEIVPALLNAGINIVTFANNHSYDKGRKGVKSTLNVLKKYGMKYVGAGINEKSSRRGLILEKSGLKIGIIGYTSVFNINKNRSNPNFVRVNDFRKTEIVMEDIKRIKQKVDFLVLIVHWGVEYVTRPQKKDRELARLYIDNGVDMIIGHHPHVLQYIENYKAKDGRSAIIAYSLGNFISNQAYYYNDRQPVKKGRERDSVIFSMEIVKKPKFALSDNSNKQYAVFLKRINLIPVWTINRRNYNNRKKFIKIRTYLIEDLIKKSMIKLKAQASSSIQKTIYLKKIKLYKTRLEHIKKVLFQNGIPEKVTFITGGDQN